MTTDLIKFSGVSKVYGHGQSTVTALDKVDLSVPQGQFIAVIGPSGSGKSTMMNIIGCLDTPSSGAYHFKGIDAGRLDRDRRALLRREFIGFVFQGFNLLARTTALENVELPLLYRGVPAAERRRKSLEALDIVGLSDRAGHGPAEQSGGQQQRVAIARAIVTRPLMLVADEPTGALDSRRSAEIIALLQRLNTEQGISIVLVTHDPNVAASAHRIISCRDGAIDGDRLSDAGNTCPSRAAHVAAGDATCRVPEAA